MTKIYLTHSPSARANYYGERPLAQLRALGEVTLNPHERILPLDEFIEAAGGCEIIVASRDAAAPAEVFERLPALQAYCRVAVDIRNIDVEAASRHGVLVTRATPGFDTSVCEWVLGAMIDLSRGISRTTSDYWRRRKPAIVMGRELRGSTLGVVGYGFIGKRLAALGQALGMNVVVFDPLISHVEAGLVQLSFDALLACADYVVCLAPAVPETADLFGCAAFAQMQRHAYFINASRGELLDEAALRAALDEGVIAGAALDVGRAPDQMPSPELAAHPLIVATPHVGGLTPPAAEHQAMDTVRQVRALLAGQAPEGAVNPRAAARLQHLPGFSGALKEHQGG